jgi:hypothetical protein
MSFFEAAVQGPGGVIGVAVGWVGARYVVPAVGGVLRPIAKTVIKGVLAVNDEVNQIIQPPRRERPRNQTSAVRIAVGAKAEKSSTPRARRSRQRPPSTGRRPTRRRKAHAPS